MSYGKPIGVTCAAGWCGGARSTAPLGGVPRGWFLVSEVLDGLAPVCGLCAEVEQGLFWFRSWLRGVGMPKWSQGWGGRAEPLTPPLRQGTEGS